MEFQEDDLFVIIVDEDTKDVNNGSPNLEIEKVDIKEEVFSELDNRPVEKLIEQATLHGECLFTFSPVAHIKTEVNETIEEDSDHSEISGKVSVKHEQNEEKQRYRMLKPWQSTSFIQKLKDDFPEAAKKSNTLIQLIVNEMRKIKTPVPEDGCYELDPTSSFFKCSICGSSSETEPAASRHYQEKHGPRYLICFACGANFRSKTNLYKHEKHCIAHDAVLMLKARALFLGNKGRHRPFLPRRVIRIPKKPQVTKKRNPANKTGPVTWMCEMCPAVFRSVTALSSHQNQHRGERPYLCELCHNAYTSPSALSRHRRRHGDQKFTCDHCQRSFKLKDRLVVHMDIHLPEPRFACSECPRRYSQRAALVLHVTRDHRRQPPAHACHICQKRFYRLTNLKSHMKKVHGMLIITRKMFFKQLPRLKEIGLHDAKVVYKSNEQNKRAQDSVDLDSPEEMLKMLTSLQDSDGSYVTFVDKGDFICLKSSEVVEEILGI